jgi:hypothetical protein
MNLTVENTEEDEEQKSWQVTLENSYFDLIL